MKFWRIRWKKFGSNVKRNFNKSTHTSVGETIFIDREKFFFSSALSHQKKTTTISKLNQMRTTIEERTKNIQLIVENHQKTLARHIDEQIEQLEQMCESKTTKNVWRFSSTLESKRIEEPTTNIEQCENFFHDWSSRKSIRSSRQLKFIPFDFSKEFFLFYEKFAHRDQTMKSKPR